MKRLIKLILSTVDYNNSKVVELEKRVAVLEQRVDEYEQVLSGVVVAVGLHNVCLSKQQIENYKQEQ